jgi:hypothetical protein
VFVLGQQSDQLEIVGRIDGIAPGEDVYAVRFVDSRGYVVTFLRVDPLFVLNLSDSTNPTIEGELHIPGFSEYLHPIDENHLLGIGRDADPQTGARGELQVSLFDVSNAADPRLVDRFSFPGLWGTWSPGEADHLAVSYYPDSQTLALPVTGQTGPPWTWDGGVPPDVVNALYVLQIDTEAGIELRGTVEHPSQVMRSARIGQSLISVSWDTLKVSAIDNPADVIGQVHYLPPTIPGSNPPSPSAEDIDVLFREAAAGTGDLTFDRDGNAVVDQDDVEFLVHAVLKTEFGDCDLDGAVDFADFVTLANHFDQQGGWAEGDFDGDGVVGFSDFLLLSSHFNA